jgi:hypothetical protein
MNHTNWARDAVRLAMVLTFLSSVRDAIAGERTTGPARNTAVFAAPDDAELLAAYQGDRSNQKVQSWGQYRGWVQTFYKGNLMSEGWTKFGEVTVSKVRSATARQAVITQIAELGRIISLEWSKDSSVRKITTTDLRRWNDVMSAARQRDAGSGQQIIDALRAVRTMAEKLR